MQCLKCFTVFLHYFIVSFCWFLQFYLIFIIFFFLPSVFNTLIYNIDQMHDIFRNSTVFLQYFYLQNLAQHTKSKLCLTLYTICMPIFTKEIFTFNLKDSNIFLKIYFNYDHSWSFLDIDLLKRWHIICEKCKIETFSYFFHMILFLCLLLLVKYLTDSFLHLLLKANQ